MGRLQGIVRAEDVGTLQDDTSFDDDETQAIVIERFQDAESLVQHGQNLAHLMEPILVTGECHGELLGDPGEELQATLTPDGPVRPSCRTR